MNRTVGNRYRVFFSLLCWAALLYMFGAAHSSAAVADHPVSRFILLSALLLTMSFSIFTFVIWLADRRRRPHHSSGSK